MSYTDPKQAIDNSIGIISQVINNFLSKTTKDIQTFAANRKAKDEAYKKSVEKKTYGAQEQLRKEFLQSKQQLNEMNRKGDGTKDLKGMTKQAMNLLKSEYKTASKDIEAMLERGDDVSLIKERLNEAIMWQGDFYTGMVKFSTSQSEYLAMQEAGKGEVGAAIGSADNQTNTPMYEYWNQIYDNVEQPGEFNLISTPDKGTMISMGDPANPSNLIDVTAANAIADKNGQYFQKNMLYDPKTETKGITDILTDMLGTQAKPSLERKNYTTNGKEDGPLDKDAVYTYLIKENGLALNDTLLIDAPNMWASMNAGQQKPVITTAAVPATGTTPAVPAVMTTPGLPKYTDDAFLTKLFDNSYDLWANKLNK